MIYNWIIQRLIIFHHKLLHSHFQYLPILPQGMPEQLVLLELVMPMNYRYATKYRPLVKLGFLTPPS